MQESNLLYACGVHLTTIGTAIVLLPLHWAYPHRLLLFDVQGQEVIIVLTVGLVVSKACAGAGFL